MIRRCALGAPLALLALFCAPGARAELSAALAPPPRPAELRVPIQLVPAPDVEPRAGTPVTTGVPFAEGWLASPSGLRLVTESGEPVPAQLSVRGSWPRTGGVRWLGVDFQLAQGAQSYALVAGGGEGPTPASPVRIEESADAITVSTGELRAEIPRRGGMLRRVWWRGQLVIEQDEANWFTHLADGRRASDKGDPETRAEVELAGPLHAVVRVDGRYRGGPQDPTPRWTVRLHFHAGRPTIGVGHTFTWVGTADRLQIRELALDLRLARPATRAAVDQASRPGDGAVEAVLRNGRQLALLQDRHFAWGAGESRFSVLAGTEARPENVGGGERAGSWIDASDGHAGVSLVLRDLWQQHPKELRASADHLTAYLWSGRGASQPLDLRLEALERLIGSPVLEQIRSPKHRQQWGAFRDPRWHDPTGLAKSHDLLLVFHDGDWRAGGVEAAADAFDHEPLVLPDPRWTEASEVAGRLAARDPAAFPELEASVSRVWQDVLALVEDFGDYGFFGYGSGPHHAYQVTGGRAVASPWRFSGGVEYGFARAAWLAWLRSGERSYHELAAVHSRYLNDVVLCHEDSGSRRRGDWFWSAGIAVIPWGGAFPEPRADDAATPALGVLNGFGFFIEHALYRWYLTGDARSLDVTREYASALKAAIRSRPDWAASFVAQMNTEKSRHAFQRLEELAVLWEQLGDPWFRAEADRLAGLLLADTAAGIHLEPPSPGGVPLPYPYAIFYKAPNLLRYAQVVDGRAREAALAAFLRSAEYTLRTHDRETRTLGLRMAYAFALSGDPLYLAYARDGLRERAAAGREPASDRGYRIKLGGVPALAYNTIANEAFLMPLLRGQPSLPEPPPALWKERGLPAADLVLRKPAGRALALQVSAAESAFEDPGGKPWPERWTRARRDYPREGSAAPFTWRDVQIPAEAPAGDYRIRVSRDGGAALLATDAPGLVLAAPGGLQLGGETDAPWYFDVPQGVESLRVRASELDLVELRDARGEPVPIPRSGEPELQVPEGGSGVWSVRASGPTAFSLEGVAPVFAYASPQRLVAAAAPERVVARNAGDEREPWPPAQAGRGLRLSGRDALVLPVGARLGDGRFELFDAVEGTLEFLVRPDWDAALLPYRSFKGLFALEAEDGALGAYYVYSANPEGEPHWDLVLQSKPPGGEQETFRAVRGSIMRWTPDAWVHVALVWFPEEKGGQRWALYVNGWRSADRQGGVKRVWQSFMPRELTRIRIGASGPWKDGAIDGVVDAVRISSVARYRPADDQRTTTFVPPRELTFDEHTLALFPLDGDARGQAAGGRSIEAQVERAPARPRPAARPRRESRPDPPPELDDDD